MALKDWRIMPDRNPYHHKKWINIKKRWILTIISDIGFGKQRNVVIEDYATQTYSGFKVIHTQHLGNQKEALKFASSYMERH